MRCDGAETATPEKPPWPAHGIRRNRNWLNERANRSARQSVEEKARLGCVENVEADRSGVLVQLRLLVCRVAASWPVATTYRGTKSAPVPCWWLG